MIEKPTVHYIDSHAHLDFADYANGRETLIRDIFASGCLAVVNPGVDIASSHAAIELTRTHKRIFAAVGIHPHEAIHYLTSGDDIFDFLHRDIETLRELAAKDRVVAIGECGLDYYRLKVEEPQRSKIIDIQKEVFRMQIELAQQKNLPLIMHIRDAHEDVIELLDITEGVVSGVAHCYEGTWPVTEALLAKGLYIGFTANITYPKKNEVHDIIKKIPLERILLETDSPYLSPQVRRGQQNDPRSVIEVGETIATIKGFTPNEVFLQTTKNAMELFGLPIL